MNVNEVMSDEYVEQCLTEVKFLNASGNDRAGRMIECLMAKIDNLMLEFCPKDMSPKQAENWANNQKPYEPFKDEKFEKWLKNQHRI
mgnify:CR=1 FL=1